MAYAFDKINKYLDRKKNKDETNELFKSRPGTRSQTSATGSDFKALTTYPGQKGALATTNQPGQKFSKAAAGRKAFKSLRGEKGDKIPGFLGGMRADFDERKASLTKKAKEFKEKTKAQTEDLTKLPGSDSARSPKELIESHIKSGAPSNNTTIWKRILDENKRGGAEIKKPELPPLPKITIPEGKQVSKQAITDILRSGRRRYTPGISDFDTRLFYSIPGFAENVKSLGKDQAALRSELEKLYTETYKESIADRKKKYEAAAKIIEDAVANAAGTITNKQKEEAEHLKAQLRDFYDNTQHDLLKELNKIIKDKYRPITSNVGPQNVLGRGLGPELSSGSRDLNEDIIRRFYDKGVGSIQKRDQLLQKYLKGEPITQADWMDLGAYTARATGTSGTPSYRVYEKDIKNVTAKDFWTPDEIAQMRRAKDLADITGKTKLSVPQEGSLGDLKNIYLTLTEPEQRPNYPYIEKVLFGDAADKKRKYLAVYNDILKNQLRQPRSGGGTFGATFPFYHSFGLPEYTAPGSRSLYNTHKKAIEGGKAYGGNPTFSFIAYLSREGKGKANTWMNDMKEEIMPFYGSMMKRWRGGKEDPYSKQNQSWFRPAMVGNIAHEMKRQGNTAWIKKSVTNALMNYAANISSGAYSDYVGINTWKKALAKMLGAARGSGYNFAKDKSPEAMKIKNSLPADWSNANFNNTNSLKRPPNGGRNEAFANLMSFLSTKLNDYSVADLFYQILAPTTRRNAGDRKMRGGIFDETLSDEQHEKRGHDWRIKRILDAAGGPNATSATISWLTPQIYSNAFHADSTVLTPNDARILNEIGKRGGASPKTFNALGFRNNNKTNMYSDSNLDRKKLGGNAVLLNNILTNKRKFDAKLLVEMMMGNDAMQTVLGPNESYVW